jgi:hypothetical protein
VAGNTFKVVEPGVTITIPAVQSVKFTGTATAYSEFGLLGVHMIADSTVQIHFEKLVTSLAATIIECDYISFEHGSRMDNVCWYVSPLTHYMDDPDLVNAWCGGAIIKRCAGGTSYVRARDGSEISFITLLRCLDTDRGSARIAVGSIDDAANYGLDIYGDATTIYVHGTYVKAQSTKYGIRQSIGAVDVIEMFVERAAAAVRIGMGTSGTLIETLKGTDANVTNALLVGQGANVAVDASGCTLVGATGAGDAVKWSSGAANSAYPAANLHVTDTHGAQVVGY